MTNPTTSDGDTYADFVALQYERNVRQIVRGLRALADKVEQVAVPGPKPSATGTPRYTYAAQQVHHELAWGIANLGSYHLIGAASAVDRAEKEATDGAS